MNFCNFHSINDLLSDSKITQDSLLHKKKKKNEVYKRNHSNIEFEEI